MKSYLNSLFNRASEHNRRNILSFAAGQNCRSVLDLGCDNGEWTMKIAKAVHATDVSGVEIVPERARLAEGKGIKVSLADLSQKIPLPDSSFDFIHSNQVIEHVSDIDLFASEIMRLLKPGGAFVVSTENGSSWHNIAASILGWQMFSLTNLSALGGGVGNPAALHRNEPGQLKSWTHKVIFNYRGLLEFFQLHGFKDGRIKGAGYYPLPSIFGALDPRHSHFITIFGRKPG